MSILTLSLFSEGFSHHGSLIQQFNYDHDKQVLVLPEQHHIDTLALTDEEKEELKQELSEENDHYERVHALNPIDHMTGQYQRYLLQHLYYYLFGDNASQHERYKLASQVLEIENESLKHKAMRARRPRKKYIENEIKRNINSIEWLNSVAPTISAETLIYGGITDKALESRIQAQLELPELKAFREQS